MQETSNQKKNRLLGEPYGTATSRLRKMLLFDMATRLDEAWCYRCSYRILTIEEFSIEHTIPWQGTENPRETFFDITKIKFSHLFCNSSAAYKKSRLETPNGLLWCGKGKHYQPKNLFYTDTTRSDGFRTNCIPCHIQVVDKSRRKMGKRPEEKKFSKPSKYT
jgi:hypothetical protein